MSETHQSELLVDEEEKQRIAKRLAEVDALIKKQREVRSVRSLHVILIAFTRQMKK
jgi:hypothetical protein